MKQRVAESSRPRHCSPHTCRKRTNYIPAFAKLLDINGYNLQQHPSRRIIHTLVHSIYDEPEKRAATVEIAMICIISNKRVLLLQWSLIRANISYPSRPLAHPVELR